MNHEIQQTNIEFGFSIAQNGTISNKNSLRKEALYQYDCFRLFDDYNGPSIGMGRFIKGLHDNNWNVIKAEINPKDNVYQLYSKKYNVIINLKISTDLKFQEMNKADYQQTLNLLNYMCKGIEIKNNKVIPLFQDDKNKQYKNLKVYSKSKKILSKKTKIVLLTLAATAIAIFAGKAIGDTLSNSNDKQNNNQYTYQESPVPGVSKEIYDKSIEIAKQDATEVNDNQQINAYQSYDAGDFTNQNVNYYYEGQVYYQSPIQNVSDDAYNRSIQAAQQQSYRR